MTISASALQKIPNFLTACRLAIVPIFVVLLINPTPTMNIWACGLFIVASVTDWLDGVLARRYHAESAFGSLFDPLADKILVSAALVMLTALPGDAAVSAWIVVTLLTREMIVTGLRSFAVLEGIVVPAGRWAKHKTAWTMLAITFLLVSEPYEVAGILINFHWAGMVFLWIALAFSIGTGASYLWQLRFLFSSADLSRA